MSEWQEMTDVTAGQMLAAGTINTIHNNLEYIYDTSLKMHCSYKDLKCKVNATNPNYQIDLSWEELWIETIPSQSVSGLTLDITASGALGLDTGSEDDSTWYYVWAIAKDDGTTSAILSASATAPTLPSGYTKKRLVSYVRNDGSSNFVAFGQQDTTYYYTAYQTFIENVSSGTDVDVSSTLQTIIPEGVTAFWGTWFDQGGAASSTMHVQTYVNGDWITLNYYTSNQESTGTGQIGWFTRFQTYERKMRYSITYGNHWVRPQMFEVPLEPYAHPVMISSSPAGTSSNPFAIGAVYVQFPSKSSPADLFGGTWSKLFDTEGITFRTEGGYASSFGGGLQEDAMQGHRHPPLTGDFVTKVSSGGTWTLGGGIYLQGIDGTTDDPSTDGTHGTPRTDYETRMRNRTIRVWERIA